MPGGWELLIILGVIVLLFGAKKLPDMARSVGQSARIFKGEMKGMKADEEPREPAPAPEPQAPPALPAAGQQSPPEQARSAQQGPGDTTR
ncbi:MAG TPA: Sec-independent protein translocase subunit TatA [Pseudonocardia sp.]|jgi:sec-independent protein translocase protein TatA|nr:Sec-independent protein translocase subunit TatA [Pseudonocardia sp.]